jgi:hypothetical protein
MYAFATFGVTVRNSMNRKPKMRKYTKKDFDRQFPDDATCLEWLKSYFYPNCIFCRKCNRVTKHHRITSRPSYLLRLLRPSRSSDRGHDLSQIFYASNNLVLCRVPDGVYALRHLRKANRAGNRRHLQDRLAHGSNESVPCWQRALPLADTE